MSIFTVMLKKHQTQPHFDFNVFFEYPYFPFDSKTMVSTCREEIDLISSILAYTDASTIISFW